MKTLSVASRAAFAQASPTLTITARANALKAEGKDVVSFGAGEPDFPTPQPICEAAIEAIKNGFTKYTPTSGIKELKEEIVAKLATENGVSVKPEQIVVSCGAKHSLYNSAQMLIDPGDEVLLIAPYWMTYYDQVRLAGGVPVIVESTAEDNFVPRREAIKEKVTAKTKAIFINSPSNPTGAVYPRQTMKEIAQIAIQHDLWVICDEIYEKLVYGGAEHVSIASLGSEMLERTITIGGCSKTFAMTGWRIGYAAAPAPVAKAMANLQDSMTSNPTSFAQRGAVEAFKMGPEMVEKMRLEFEGRRDLVKAELSRIPGLGVTNPAGAFYILIDVRKFLGGKVRNDHELAELLLEEGNVATVPGTVFDAAGYLRLSYTASRENIKKGVSRIGEVLATLPT